jgi:hypothetical protein
MFTTGSKFLIGASVVAVLATVMYGITQGGVLGTVGLASGSISLIFLAGLNLILRDSNVHADDAAPVESSSAAQFAPSPSAWPLAFAFGAITVAVGLVSYQPIFVVGFVVLLVAGAEWVVQAWSERASSNAAHNAQVRSRVSNPFEYPVGGAVAIGAIVYGFSRIMLWLSKTNTVVAFVVLAAVVVTIGFIIAFRPSLKSGAVGGVVAAGAIAVIGAGTVAGLDGERSIPEFETTSIWQEEALLHPEEYAESAEEGEHPAGLICESGEEFPEADEDASQTVASKSNAIQVFLRADGTLDYDPPGPIPPGSNAVTVQRSNPTNFIFRNESNEHARLSIDLGTMTVDLGTEDEPEEVEVRNQICTTLVEGGGAQLLTVKIDQPSYAFSEPNPNGPGGEEGSGFWFFVPGIDSATLQVDVP